jgi:serine/threonine protein kinase/predicted Zn-dependent protease
MSESSAERNLLDVLAEEFVARFRAGERPALREYIERHPDLADEIRDLFPALVEMECYKPADQTTDFPVPLDGPSGYPGQIGEFRILREVGRGGMGVVYEAVQETLGRHVALKVLPTRALADPRRAERFRREARAAAKLHHTNIVPVFGTGETDGLHYYAMQFIPGQGLDRVIDELRRLRQENPSGATEPSRASLATAQGPGTVSLSGTTEPGITSASGRRYWESVARLGAQAADALAHAHAQGVLHRDIKPANLLLDPQGIVWVTDFGLAKLADEEDLTRAGDVVGTLRYLAPERFEGRCDTRADIYALGLTLYELLTLRPAFDEKARENLIAQVMQGTPQRPTQLRREVPRDLETIVLKALAREPEARYGSAADLAEDLRRFAEDRPIQARRAGPGERLWRWSRRNPVVAALTAALLLVLIGGATAAILAAVKFRDLADEKSAELNRLHEANGLLETGFRHAVRKDWPRALADYAAAIEKRPDYTQVWSDRALLYLRLGLAQEAAGDFDQLFKVHPPSEPAWWYFHAALRLHVGDVDGYRSVCAQMREQFTDPASPEVIRALVQTCTLAPGGMDDPKELVRLVDEAEERFPNENWTAPRVAALYRAGQDRELVRLTAPADPSKAATAHPAELCFRAMSQHRLGEIAPAKSTLAAAVEKLNATASVLSLQAFGPRAADLFVGSFPPADSQEGLADWIVNDLLYQEASAGSQHPLPLFIRARGCAALGWWELEDEATGQAGKVCWANEKAPLLPEIALVERSRLNALRGRWTEVAEDLKRAEDVARPPYSVRSLAARLYTAYGRDAEARQHLAEAVAKSPSDLDLRLERGRSSIRLADWSAAADDLNAILSDQRFLPPLRPRGAGGFGGGFYSRYFPQIAGGPRGSVSPTVDVRKEVREEIVKEDELYARIRAKRPLDDLLAQERGRFLLHARRFPAATEHYSEWVTRDRRSGSNPQRVLDLISEDVAPYDEVFEALVGRFPDHPGLGLARASWRLKTGDVEKAADAIEQALPIVADPAPGDVARETAYSRFTHHEELFRILADRRPTDADLWMARFQQQTGKRAWAGAEEAARRIARERGGNHLVLRKLASDLSPAPRPVAAAEYTRRALELMPEDISLHNQLIALTIRLENWDQAADAFARAVRQASAPGQGPWVLQSVYEQQAFEGEAFEQLSRRRPQDGRLWLVRGRRLSQGGKLEEALPCFEKAAELSPNNLDCWIDLTRACVHLRKWDQVARALDMAPRNEPALNSGMPTIDRLYEVLPSEEASLGELTRRRPNDEMLWLQRGWKLAAGGAAKEALAPLLRATEVGPKNPRTWIQLARTRASLEQWKEAAVAYDKALSLLPPIPYADPQNVNFVTPSLYGEIVSRTMQGPQGKCLFDALSQLRPNDGRLWFEYARSLNNAYFALPPPLRAELVVAVDELVKHAPKEPLAWLERASFRAKEKDFDRAADDYVAAAELLPRTTTFNPLTHKLYWDLTALPEVFDRFTARRKDDPLPWSHRAFRRSSEPGHPAFATWEADIRRAIAIRPEEPLFRANLRFLLMEFGRWDDAAGEYAAEMKRQKPAAGNFLWVEAAATYAAAGKTKEYQALCQRMAEEWNKLEQPQYGQQLAWSAGLQAQPDLNLERLLALARAAQKADPGPIWNTFTVALMHYRLRQPDKTLQVLRDYQRTYGTYSLPLHDGILVDLLRGLALVHTGKKDEARKLFQDACMRTDNHLHQVRKTRQRLGPGHAWAAVVALRREAEAVLGAAPAAKEKP